MIPKLTGMVLEGKYRLTEPIGAGGMGVVYAAQHIRLGRALAVKVLRPELAADPAALARFQQEAVAASRIGNPHIIEVIDLGATPGGAPFIVMEYLQGSPLSDVLAEAPVMAVPRAADIMRQILSALGAAHAQGIVHRDLKPENVFLVRDDERPDFVKLLDFGISKVRSDAGVSQLTQTGAVLGTPRYMAPEQAMGRRDVDHRVDLWAAGVILYRALTGRHPYDADSYNALLAAILMTDAPPPRSIRPDIDPGLDGTLRRALARDPAARFQSAEAFRAALDPYVSRSPAVPATPCAPAAPGAPAWTDPPTPMGAAATVTASGRGAGRPHVVWIGTLVAAVAAASVVTWLLVRGGDRPAPAPPAVPSVVSPVLAATSDAGPADPASSIAEGSVLVLSLEDPTPAETPDATGAGPAPPDAEATESEAAAEAEASDDPERDKYVAIQAGIACSVLLMAMEDFDGPDSLGIREPLAMWNRTLASHGVDGSGWATLASKYAGDPIAQEEIARRTEECLAKLDETEE